MASNKLLTRLRLLRLHSEAPLWPACPGCSTYSFLHYRDPSSFSSSLGTTRGKKHTRSVRQHEQRSSPSGRESASSSSTGGSTKPEDKEDGGSADPYSWMEKEGVVQRTVYSAPEKRNVNLILVYAAGASCLAFFTNATDIAYRAWSEPDKETGERKLAAPWKRLATAAGLFTIGLGAFACSFWIPTRFISKITLHHPPLPTPNSPIPYKNSLLTFHNLSIIPFLNRGRLIPFTAMTLLGPISNSPKWYHPQKSQAFNFRKKSTKLDKDGKPLLPSHVPIIASGDRLAYSIDRGGKWEDMEGFERAMLQYGPVRKSRSEGGGVSQFKQGFGQGLGNIFGGLFGGSKAKQS